MNDEFEKWLKDLISARNNSIWSGLNYAAQLEDKFILDEYKKFKSKRNCMNCYGDCEIIDEIDNPETFYCANFRGE